jgi:hypothetical protein
MNALNTKASPDGGWTSGLVPLVSHLDSYPLDPAPALPVPDAVSLQDPALSSDFSAKILRRGSGSRGHAELCK